MSMIRLFDKCPHIAVNETRTLRFNGSLILPDGEYGFIELYCDDPKCDCRRVLIQVMTPTSGQKVWATINYGWENAGYYKKWCHSNDDDYQGPFLDPINAQSPYAGTLLELFKQMLNDKAYVECFAKHYGLFRKQLTAKKRQCK